MLSSSIQATLAGRFGNSEYGRSKKAGEELFFQYAEETGAKAVSYTHLDVYKRQMQGWTMTPLQIPGCAMCRLRSLKPIKSVCRATSESWREIHP